MKCGNCTLCCRLPVVPSLNKEKGVWCEFCEIGVGCKIYNVRPNECRQYQCMWSQMEHSGEELRPDKCHMLFEKVSDKTICGAQEPEYELSDLVKRQIDFFLRDGFSVIIIKKGLKTVYVAKGHSFDETKRDLNDRSKLYRRFE